MFNHPSRRRFLKVGVTVAGGAAVAMSSSVSWAGPIQLRETFDVAYGPDPLQRLDIYSPEEVVGSRPAVLWFHGGGWEGGDKRVESNAIGSLAPFLVEKGFIAVSGNYRLAPKHRHPAQVDDVQRVVRWLRANAEKYHIDPNRIGAAGISAGGHLVAMLAVRETRAKQGNDLDQYSSKVQAAVSLAGPTELQTTPELSTPIIERAIGNLSGNDPARAKEVRKDASPIRFVTEDSAPILFIVGSADPWVPNAHATRMAEALRRHKVDTRVLVLQGAGHGIFPSTTPEAREALGKWFAEKLKKGIRDKG